MTKEEALSLEQTLRLAFEALENSLPRLAPYGEQDWLDSKSAINGIKATLLSRSDGEAKDEPVVWNEGVPAMLPKQKEGETFIVSYEPKLEAKDEPVAHSVVAGALFDFMGWLTSRDKRLILSSVDEASPAVEAITEFAKKRNLSLKYAEVGYWMEFLSTPPQQEAKDEPVQKPVAWMYEVNHAHTCLDLFEPPDDAYDEGTLYPLYTTPPQRTWVGLTDEERGQVYVDWRFNGSNSSNLELCKVIEAKLKEKNGYA